MYAAILFTILSWIIVLNTNALTLKEIEEKINNLDTLEHNLKKLVEKVANLEDKLEKRNNKSEDEFEQHLNNIEKMLVTQKQRLPD